MSIRNLPTRQQRRADERRARKLQQAPVSTTCTCGCGIANPTPEQMADVRAYIRSEYGIDTIEHIHAIKQARAHLFEAHEILARVSREGVAPELMNDLLLNCTGEAMDTLDGIAYVDPADVEGYAA